MINFPTASETRQNCAPVREQAIEYCLGYILKAIQRANAQGKRSTCLTPTGHYVETNGYRCYLDVTEDLKVFLKSKGYTIEPTGYIGGVW